MYIRSKANKVDVQELSQKFIGKIVGRYYKVLNFIDNGSFCAVFRAEYIPLKESSIGSQVQEEGSQYSKKSQKGLQRQQYSNISDQQSIQAKIEQEKILYYCFKVEDHFSTSQQKITCSLEKEANVLKQLKNEIGFPKIYYFQKDISNSYVITSLLGKNLGQLHKQCKKRFSLRTLCMIGYQVIARLETLHGHGILHRDIKPENLMIGYEGQSKRIIYMVDFGLSCHFRLKDGSHIEFKKQVGSIGTMRYNSISCHKQEQQSRRDDLESFGYVLLYLYFGKLPWINLKIDDFWERNKEILEHKQSIPHESLCVGLPEEFTKYFQYVLSLSFHEEPSYKYLKNLFKTIIHRNKWHEDFYYDWEDIPSLKKPNTSQSLACKESSTKKYDTQQKFHSVNSLNEQNIISNSPRNVPSNQVDEVKSRSDLSFYSCGEQHPSLKINESENYKLISSNSGITENATSVMQQFKNYNSQSTNLSAFGKNHPNSTAANNSFINKQDTIISNPDIFDFSKNSIYEKTDKSIVNKKQYLNVVKETALDNIESNLEIEVYNTFDSQQEASIEEDYVSIEEKINNLHIQQFNVQKINKIKQGNSSKNFNQE